MGLASSIINSIEANEVDLELEARGLSLCGSESYKFAVLKQHLLIELAKSLADLHENSKAWKSAMPYKDLLTLPEVMQDPDLRVGLFCGGLLQDENRSLENAIS